jgi:hypothetical protein
MLSRFSDVPMDKLAIAIKELNEDVISLDNLKGLKQFIPTTDEVIIIYNYFFSFKLEIFLN